MLDCVDCFFLDQAVPISAHVATANIQVPTMKALCVNQILRRRVSRIQRMLHFEKNTRNKTLDKCCTVENKIKMAVENKDGGCTGRTVEDRRDSFRASAEYLFFFNHHGLSVSEEKPLAA